MCLDVIQVVVVSQGRVVEARTLRPNLWKSCDQSQEPGTFKYSFDFTLVFEMVTQGNVLVYYVKNGKLKVAQTYFTLRQFNNFLYVHLSAQKVKPRDKVDIDVQTLPDSQVGLVGVDQSVILLAGNGYDLSSDQIFNDLDSLWYQTAPRPGNDAGLRFIPFQRNQWWQFQVSLLRYSLGLFHRMISFSFSEQ